MTSKRVRWAGHEAGLGKSRNKGKAEGNATRKAYRRVGG
jgi:hypothetical protein